jgi:hypothetical protein
VVRCVARAACRDSGNCGCIYFLCAAVVAQPTVPAADWRTPADFGAFLRGAKAEAGPDWLSEGAGAR